MILSKNKIKDDNDISENYEDRKKKLELLIAKFESVALNYGPASSEELKTRVNKIIRRFDKELKSLLEKKFEGFWKSRENNISIDSHATDKSVSPTKIPKFLKNYKK